MTTHQYLCTSGEFPPQKTIHCNRYGWENGDCQRLHCKRCGKRQAEKIKAKIITASQNHNQILFMTVYWDYRRHKTFDDLPLFGGLQTEETKFRQNMSKLTRALRDKARRDNVPFEYVMVIAFGEFAHRIHRHIHSHALVTWLPQIVPHKRSKNPHRLTSKFIEKKLAKMELAAWIESPRSIAAVAAYTAQNIEPAIGQEFARGIRLVRWSKWFAE